MEIKSEPKYDTIQVTDLDIAFPDDLQTYTLKDGLDSLTNDGTLMIVTFAGGGTVRFNLQHAHWYAKRHRTLRVLVPESPSAG